MPSRLMPLVQQPRMESKMRRSLLLTSLCLGALTLDLGAGFAANGDVWHVENKLVGKKDKKSKDVSGIACRQASGFPRDCLVIDDELQSAQFVTVKDEEIKAGKSIPLIGDSFNDEKVSLDGEGVAYAHGFFYVVGSHGHPRDPKHKLDPVADAQEISAKIAASSQLVRISDDGSVEPSSKLPAVVKSVPELQPFVDQRLDENGVTIEGVAVLGDRLFAGFRGPSLKEGRAAIVSARIDALFGDADPDVKSSFLPLGDGRGVRDLSVWQDGFLVLAGPTANTNGDYSVFWWDGKSTDVALLGDLPALPGDGEQIKPEAILPLDSTADGLRVLILSDGGTEGEPRSFLVKNP